jgi:lipopolysaccharide/colanic/teichoic acid biosynthesis glycosyltransferase
MIVAHPGIQATDSYLIFMNNSKISIFRFRRLDSITPSSHMRLSAGTDLLDGSTSFKLPVSCGRSEIDGAIEDCEEYTVMLKEKDFSKSTIDLGGWLFRQSGESLNAWARIRSQMEFRYSSNVMKRWFDKIKRCCDVVGALIFLLIFFPLLIVIAALIKLDSAGPILFRHSRVGKNGVQFVLWKFRSMKVDVPRYETSPSSGEDMRLTHVGRLIRRLSLDEVPQLFNVLKGEMSLVGPRPEMPFIVECYGVLERERLAVKPGITGLWQISPARAFPIHENLQYDLYYVRHHNLFLDCAILVRTITAVIRGVGAV